MPKYITECDVEQELLSIGVDDKAIDYLLEKSRFRILKLKGIKCHIANIMKQDMLSIGGDVAVNKGCVNCSVEHTDVLVMGTIKQIRLFTEKLCHQAGSCKDVAEELKAAIKGQ